MNYNRNITKNNSTGRLCDPVDGDEAVMAKQTVLCPGACSIKDYENDSPGRVGTGRETLISGNSHKTQQTSERQSLGQVDLMLKRSRSIESRKKEIWSGINKKQGIRIATLNLKGRNDKDKKSKWPTLETMMRKQRILVLGIQETHLNDEEAEKVKTMCPKLEIINNGIHKNKEGVAFVINKELANNMTWDQTTLIEGRASRLKIKVEEERGLDVIVIYAPNNDNEKANFFETLKEKLEQEKELENVIIMGDFNCVEQELDRFPHRKDDEKVTKNWLKIKKKHKLIDGWRVHNELNKSYTYMQPASNSMSRIDRIYLNDEIYPYGYNWSHINSAKLSDHDMVAVDILKSKLPYIGEGLWRMNQDELNDERVKKATDEVLKRTEIEMKRIIEENEETIQEVWAEAKEDIKRLTIEAKKIRQRNLEKKKEKMKKEIDEKLKEINNEVQAENNKNIDELIRLKKKLSETTRSELIKLQESAKARYRSKGEKYTKYWFRLNKKKLDDKIILALQKEDGTLTDKTKEMMEIALKHHEELQKKPEMTPEREIAIEKIIETMQAKTTDEDKTNLKRATSYEEIKTSIKKAPNGTAPGKDGIIYEFYKEKMKKHEENSESPDIIKILHMVINDIEKNGVRKLSKNDKEKKPEFTDGIMHLVFKKKEKWKIANYRPITLLNTDYKTYTKTIAMKLAEVAEHMIHEDQAGFVPKRSIYDQTRTTTLAIEYCEMMDKNGCIIALDQEKAYDKIDHEYLWKVLEHYEFPKEFIDKIKELYKDTGKAIIINGVTTRQYKVRRGVHQGDPMSCLLYNFAIEPLADAIRQSNLKGIKIMTEDIDRLIVSLFADDTLVYLSEKDDLNELRDIINNFCKASTARFNMEKTEYLPIGNKTYREEVIKTREFGENKIEEGVKIIKEGEAMRTLGAWVGNDTNLDLQWGEILKKQEEMINAWSKTNMSLKGKEIILKAILQSKAMYLATVNGMPKDIEEKMKKLFKDFLWDGKKRGLMAWNQIIAPREQGGLNIPDIKTRIEALEVMWMKKWLTPSDRKPKWTYILDQILNENIARSPMIDKESRINWLKQSWHEADIKKTRLSKGVRNMLRIARKYNVKLEPLKYSKETKEKEILWHNRLMMEANYQWNKKSARCLRKNHGVITIEDLIDEEDNTRCNKEPCKEMIKRLKCMIPEIIDPTKGTPKRIRSKKLDLTPSRIEKNNESNTKKTFNPDITARDNILQQVRLFDTEQGTKTRKRRIKPSKPAYRKQTNENPGETKVTLIVTTQNERKANQKIKTWIRLTGEKQETESFELEEVEQTKERAAAYGLLWALLKDKRSNLIIITEEASLIKWIGEGINEAEDVNWIEVKERELWKSILNQLRKRDRKVEIRRPNEDERDKIKEAKNELKMSEPKRVKIKIMNKNGEEFLQKGARLDKITQKTAYKLILNKNAEKPGGPQTWRRIKMIKETLSNKWNIKTEEAEIWKDLKNIKNNKLQEFIWKIIHNRIKCGEFFKHIPNWEEKQFCQCGKVESIEHILLECEETEQKDLWIEVEKIWTKITELDWEKPTIGEVMGLGSIKLESNKVKDKKLTTEILITIISTAIWSIWKNRNERIFGNKAETKWKQIESWKECLRREIRIEYKQIQEVGLHHREKATTRFMKKWSTKSKIIRIEQNTNGNRRLRINL
jgi:endonuclease/exonuclease/phosphatase family metal-dependent hydrolase